MRNKKYIRKQKIRLVAFISAILLVPDTISYAEVRNANSEYMFNTGEMINVIADGKSGVVYGDGNIDTSIYTNYNDNTMAGNGTVSSSTYKAWDAKKLVWAKFEQTIATIESSNMQVISSNGNLVSMMGEGTLKYDEASAIADALAEFQALYESGNIPENLNMTNGYSSLTIEPDSIASIYETWYRELVNQYNAWAAAGFTGSNFEIDSDGELYYLQQFSNYQDLINSKKLSFSIPEVEKITEQESHSKIQNMIDDFWGSLRTLAMLGGLSSSLVLNSGATEMAFYGQRVHTITSDSATYYFIFLRTSANRILNKPLSNEESIYILSDTDLDECESWDLYSDMTSLERKKILDDNIDEMLSGLDPLKPKSYDYLAYPTFYKGDLSDTTSDDSLNFNLSLPEYHGGLLPEKISLGDVSITDPEALISLLQEYLDAIGTKQGVDFDTDWDEQRERIQQLIQENQNALTFEQLKDAIQNGSLFKNTDELSLKLTEAADWLSRYDNLRQFVSNSMSDEMEVVLYEEYLLNSVRYLQINTTDYSSDSRLWHVYKNGVEVSIDGQTPFITNNAEHQFTMIAWEPGEYILTADQWVEDAQVGSVEYTVQKTLTDSSGNILYQTRQQAVQEQGTAMFKLGDGSGGYWEDTGLYMKFTVNNLGQVVDERNSSVKRIK